MRWARGRYRCGLAAAITVLAAAATGVAGQDADAPAIRIPPSIVAQADAEAILPIEIGPSAAIPAHSFVSLRGLPPGVGVHDAHAVGPGAWAVPLSALPGLNAAIPAGLTGQSELVVSLIALDGQLLAQARSRLVIGPDAAGPDAAGATLPGAPAPPDQLSPEARVRAERLFARGEAYLANGNIMGARDFFERAADAGLAASALRLAATYDPATLKRMQAQGIAPDVSLARKWYARARDLGATEAAERLRELGTE